MFHKSIKWSCSHNWWRSVSYRPLATVCIVTDNWPLLISKNFLKTFSFLPHYCTQDYLQYNSNYLVKMFGIIFCSLIPITGRCTGLGCTHTGQILLWPQGIWSRCLLSKRLLQSEGLLPLHVFTLSGKIFLVLTFFSPAFNQFISLRGCKKKIWAFSFFVF